MKVKTCTHCKQQKPVSEFNRDSNNPDGLQSWCNSCRADWRKKNIDYQRQYAKVNFKRYKAQQKDSHLRNKFGISLAEYTERLNKQGHVCAICGLKEWRKVKGTVCSLSVDHNHITGKVRELLCDRCNLIIGRSNEDVKLLNKIIKYLIKHGGKR